MNDELPRRRNRLTPPLFIRLYVLEMSQKEVAYYLGVSKSDLSHIEARGEIRPSWRKRYQEIAAQRFRFIPPDWFDKLPVPQVPLIPTTFSDSLALIELAK